MDQTTNNQAKDLTEEGYGFFYMAAVQVTYVRDIDGTATTRQRNLNVLLQGESANLTKADLNTLNRSAIQRVCAEHQVTPDAVKDVVFLNIVMLGFMPAQEFEGTQAPTEENVPA